MSVTRTMVCRYSISILRSLFLTAAAGRRALRNSTAARDGARRCRQKCGLRAEHFDQSIARAGFFAIGPAAGAAADTNRADHLIVDDDRQSTLLHGQAKLIHADERGDVIEGAICQHMRWLARQ